jgi:hypothetical protein
MAGDGVTNCLAAWEKSRALYFFVCLVLAAAARSEAMRGCEESS